MYYTILELKGAIRVFSSPTDRGKLTFESLKLSIGYEDSVPIAKAVQASANFKQQFSNAFYLKQSDPLLKSLQEDQQTIVTFQNAHPNFIDVARFASMLFPDACEISLSNGFETIWKSDIPVSGLVFSAPESSESPAPAVPE